MFVGFVVCLWGGFFFQTCFTSSNTNFSVLLLTLVIFVGSLGIHGINLQVSNLAIS